MLNRFQGMLFFLNGDFRWFDTSQRAPYFRGIGEVMSWLTYDNPAAFVLMEEALQAPVVTSTGEVLGKEDGMPSGAFITLVANCLMDECLILAAHYDACGPDHDHLTAAIMGDDNGIGVMQTCGLTRDTLVTSHEGRGFALKECAQHETLDDVRFCGLIYNNTGYHPREDKLICSLVYPRMTKTSTPLDYLTTIGQIRDELVFSPRVADVERWFYAEAHRLGVVAHLRSREQARAIWEGTEQQFVSGTKECLSFNSERCGY
jgi:hypothetical protein